MSETSPIEEVLAAVRLERARQDQKYGPHGGFTGHSRPSACPVLLEEVGEVARALLERNDRHLYEELIQVAAVAVAWAEALAAERGGHRRVKIRCVLSGCTECERSLEDIDVTTSGVTNQRCVICGGQMEVVAP